MARVLCKDCDGGGRVAAEPFGAGGYPGFPEWTEYGCERCVGEGGHCADCGVELADGAECLPCKTMRQVDQVAELLDLKGAQP